MRFYFDTYEGGTLVRDEEGLDVVDLAAAKLQAAKAVVDVAKDLVPKVQIGTVAIHVRDTEGRVVCTAEVNFEARSLLELAPGEIVPAYLPVESQD
ncbi:hypothetical protein [Mesorhizobium sp. B2-7-1]|uniref:DUF6894 family protein n=1 Tax=Mesorhizobium sp. B2-7-1 TaxID=2589909 RepID=UPI00112A3207|nr:hypothetical protein [Mesorhizobium sp. B2-7-1]TPJ71847.1 hypothetical protein FJ471_08100 [Mesorhizobium sp. B2-7-1]